MTTFEKVISSSSKVTSMEKIVDPIYSTHGRCINSKEVVQSILKKFPNENLYTLAVRARLSNVHTIKKWIQRNSARSSAIKKMFESLIKDYGLVAMTDFIANENITPTETTNEISKPLHIVRDYDIFIKETNRGKFIDKCTALEKKGYNIIFMNIDYYPQKDPPNIFHYAKFRKPDKLS